jgi:PadR family transcriptional regulator PadR
MYWSPRYRAPIQDGEDRMSIDKELLKGCSKTLVLKMLSRSNMHGYELATTLTNLSQGKLKLTDGTIYPLLHALETDCLIQSSWEKSSSGRKRRIYAITKEGKKILNDKTERWNEFASMMEHLLAARSRLQIA